jgi:hypothetical protein
VRRFRGVVALGLAALGAGCASLPPSKPIDGPASVAGGVISVVRPGTLHEDERRRVLRLVGDGGGRAAELTPAK